MRFGDDFDSVYGCVGYVLTMVFAMSGFESR